MRLEQPTLPSDSARLGCGAQSCFKPSSQGMTNHSPKLVNYKTALGLERSKQMDIGSQKRKSTCVALPLQSQHGLDKQSIATVIAFIDKLNDSSF